MGIANDNADGYRLLAERRWGEALGYFQREAEAGDPVAQVECARLLLHGLAGPVDTLRATAWLTRAETAGHAEAGYYLASIALGSSTPAARVRIGERIEAAALAQHPPALRAAALGVARRSDRRHQAQCNRLLERAALGGDMPAAQLLAERLYRGEGGPVRPADARRWRRALANFGVAPLPWLKPWTMAEPAVAADMLGRPSYDDAWQSPAWTLLSGRPRVMHIPRLLSVDECRLLMALAQAQAVGDGIEGPDTWFHPAIDDFTLRLVQLRMARAARTDFARTEALVVQRQEAGAPGRDLGLGTPPPLQPGQPRPLPGERQRAVCVLLSPALAGGTLGYTGAPDPLPLAPGDAVLIDSAPDEGSPLPNVHPLVTQVREGTLWTATLWLRHGQSRVY